MYEGSRGKALMIKQGYAPPKCTLPDEVAGPLIYGETAAGRDVCAGCHSDRNVCDGRPFKQENDHE